MLSMRALPPFPLPTACLSISSHTARAKQSLEVQPPTKLLAEVPPWHRRGATGPNPAKLYIYTYIYIYVCVCAINVKPKNHQKLYTMTSFCHRTALILESSTWCHAFWAKSQARTGAHSNSQLECAPFPPVVFPKFTALLFSKTAF